MLVALRPQRSRRRVTSTTQYKLVWLEALATAIEAELREPLPFAVLGDYNIAPTDADVWDRAAFEGSTHVTAPERAALAQLRGLGLRDVIPRDEGPAPVHLLGLPGRLFHKGMGMRIDLVYANDALAERSRRLRRPRGPQGQGPSDHAPVVVDLSL